MKNLLKYKEYLGTVSFSNEDQCLYGKVIGIDDLVSYESDSVSGLTKAFETAVEDYLESCKSVNKSPLKSYRGVFNIRTSPEKHQTLSILAQKNGLKLNQVVNLALDQYLENNKALS
ncbi:MAG: type II toxin-antitoxin system HicB family antitoxin [Flavobacteriaceae bacterium]|nr:type II toxin-antitoxin system HicB family antitoxin [Flavobacteriaceae bacterium]MCI5087788.1 type II toxin-antitoxin system HicB family antitoxin [Flavobacteriaceae bacterium]